MNLESRKMLTRTETVHSDVLSVVSVDSSVQGGEYSTRNQHKDFHEFISGLSVVPETIDQNEKNGSLEIDFNKVSGRELQNKHRYGDQAVSNFRPLESALPDSKNILFASARLEDRNNDSKLESIFEQDGEDVNFLILISAVMDESYRFLNHISTFDEHIFSRNDRLSTLGSQEFIVSHDQYVSELLVVTKSDYMDGNAIDVDPMSQFLRITYKAESILKNSVLSLQTDHEVLSELLTIETAPTGGQWSRRENVNAVMMEGQKTTIHSQESSTALTPLVLSGLNILKPISQKVDVDQIVGGLTTPQLNQSETVNFYGRVSSSIPSNQSLTINFDKLNPILVISIEENNVLSDVKFVSSSRELVDLMVQKQSYLRMTFKDYGIEGYDFLFQAGGDELQHRQRRVNENIQSEKYSFLCSELLEVNFEVVSGIDKRI